MIVYKAVGYEKDGSLISWALDAKAVDYKKNVRTNRPKKCGPLTAFKTEKQARAFAHQWCSNPDTYRIYKANARVYSGKKKHIWRISWQGDKRYKTDLPEGTVLCSSITLKELA